MRRVPLLLLLASLVGPAASAQLRAVTNVDILGNDSLRSDANVWFEFNNCIILCVNRDLTGTHRVNDDTFTVVSSQTFSGRNEWSGTLYPSGRPATCYRSYVEAFTDKNETQGAGSPQRCTPSPPDNTQGGNRDPYVGHGWQICPIIVDLDGDGILTTGIESPVSFFDLNYDGVREPSGWTAANANDAFLWMDVNENGSVDPGELFGSTMLMPNGVRAKNGFEVLAMYDLPQNGGNGDGEIDRHDAIWERLRLWIDINHNGVSNAHEIAPLGKYQILSLDLDTTQVHSTDAAGNMIMITGYYERRLVGQAGHDDVERALTDIAFIRP